MLMFKPLVSTPIPSAPVTNLTLNATYFSSFGYIVCSDDSEIMAIGNQSYNSNAGVVGVFDTSVSPMAEIGKIFGTSGKTIAPIIMSADGTRLCVQETGSEPRKFYIYRISRSPYSLTLEYTGSRASQSAQFGASATNDDFSVLIAGNSGTGTQTNYTPFRRSGTTWTRYNPTLPYYLIVSTQTYVGSGIAISNDGNTVYVCYTLGGNSIIVEYTWNGTDYIEAFRFTVALSLNNGILDLTASGALKFYRYSGANTTLFVEDDGVTPITTHPSVPIFEVFTRVGNSLVRQSIVRKLSQYNVTSAYVTKRNMMFRNGAFGSKSFLKILNSTDGINYFDELIIPLNADEIFYVRGDAYYFYAQVSPLRLFKREFPITLNPPFQY